MKIIFKKTFQENIHNLLRQCGYTENRGRFSNTLNFIRTFSRTPYPRFHLYVKKESPGELILNLHLDQKKPSYQGSHAHSGDYDTEVVEEETERIRAILEKL